jgi:tetratricopeptide (TPR) repeat protein
MTKHPFLGLILIGICLGASCSHEPKTTAELVEAGKKAFLAEQYAKARGYFQTGLKTAPSDKDLLYYTGLCFQRESSYDSALTYLRKADILYPRDRGINQALKPVAEITHHWGYAIGAISVLVSTGDDLHRYYRDLARYSARNGEPTITVFYQRKLKEENPDSLMEWVRLTMVEFDLDSVDVARHLIDTAVAKFGRNDQLLPLVGLLRAHEGNYPEAEKIFRSLVAKYPDASNNKVNLANVLSEYPQREKKQEAIDFLLSIPESDRGDLNVDSLIIMIKKDMAQLPADNPPSKKH